MAKTEAEFRAALATWLQRAQTLVDKIVHETDKGHIKEMGKGHYEVYKHGLTHAIRIGTYHWSNDPEKSLTRAIEKLKSLDKSESF